MPSNTVAYTEPHAPLCCLPCHVPVQVRQCVLRVQHTDPAAHLQASVALVSYVPAVCAVLCRALLPPFPYRYVNVSLEFNTLTLQPTYKLLWGSAGSSNALDIATALGFDPAVLADARILARAEMGRQEEQQGHMEQVSMYSTHVGGHSCQALELLALAVLCRHIG